MERPDLRHVAGCPLRLAQAVRPERLTTVARDSFYVGVGMAVLAFQRAQVFRREVARTMSTRPG
jgi:hypothetical protein